MRWLVPLILGGVGVALLIGGVERTVKTVRRRALLAGVSALTLGLLATSLDLESTAAGIASAAKGLGTVAAGISVGSVIFLATAALGLACVLFPFAVRILRYFLGVFIISAVAASAVLLGGGSIDSRPSCSWRSSQSWSQGACLICGLRRRLRSPRRSLVTAGWPPWPGRGWHLWPRSASHS